MRLFGKEEINRSRQFEFDLAKAVCILGMVFVHCFEELAAETTAETAAYYVVVIVLDCIFGAGTFMLCMGLGISYSWKGNADKFIKRGVYIFLLGYLLNFVRDVVPHLLLLVPKGLETLEGQLVWLLNDDILPFAGLALFLFGVLKKLKFSDLAVLLTALGMSVVGSFVRFADLGGTVRNLLAGLFIGTSSADNPEVMGCFPLLNWFIIVVIGYLYGEAIRRCRDCKRYYAIAFPVSGVFLAVYMLLAIPNRLGMMNDDILYYYHFSTPNALVLFAGAVFATSMYHYISLLFSDTLKRRITGISVNINRIYCIHWVIIGWIAAVLCRIDHEGFGSGASFAVGVAIFTVSVILAELYTRRKTSKHQTIKE